MPSTFGPQSTAEDVLAGVDLSGKRVLVTGASAGIGVETARALAAHGAEVIGTARDMEKARRVGQIIAAGAKSGFAFVELDLASLASVRACADKIAADRRPLDVIIANAGLFAPRQKKTRDGFETQFGANHLGHFVLINRLAPLLRSGARVVNLSSGAHRSGDLQMDDLNLERRVYSEMESYAHSKTANVLFTVALDKRLKGRGVRAAAVHPGGIDTELSRDVDTARLAQLRGQPPGTPRTAQTPGRKSVAQGAATSVWCATIAPAEEIGGRYCEDCHVAEIAADPSMRGGVRPQALDPARAEDLWAKSEALVGERFAHT